MKYSYKPSGVCSREIQFELEDGIVKNVAFIGGCNGNGKGVASLTEGMKAEEVIARLKNITCGSKPTSCPAQLAKAIAEKL